MHGLSETSAKVIFFENWISTPGTYFMRTFAKITMPLQGFRFVPSELLEADGIHAARCDPVGSRCVCSRILRSKN